MKALKIVTATTKAVPLTAELFKRMGAKMVKSDDQLAKQRFSYLELDLGEGLALIECEVNGKFSVCLSEHSRKLLWYVHEVQNFYQVWTGRELKIK